jgi:hypothetical protein
MEAMSDCTLSVAVAVSARMGTDGYMVRSTPSLRVVCVWGKHNVASQKRRLRLTLLLCSPDPWFMSVDLLPTHEHDATEALRDPELA